MSTDVKEWPLDIATLAPLEKKCAIEAHRHYQEGFPVEVRFILAAHR